MSKDKEMTKCDGHPLYVARKPHVELVPQYVYINARPILPIAREAGKICRADTYSGCNSLIMRLRSWVTVVLFYGSIHIADTKLQILYGL
jgi:hypothetical protein